MTVQAAEFLIEDGISRRMISTPLDQCVDVRPKLKDLTVPMTALWRGYRGTWQIIADRLYLIDIQGEYKDGTLLTLRRLFPDQDGVVFAGWYSGILLCTEGAMIRYVHMGFSSRFEREIVYVVERGHVVSRDMEENSFDESA